MVSPFMYFDIETLPDMRGGVEAAKERAKAAIKVPGNYKKTETITAYIEENAEEEWRKTALDGFRGHVCSIAVDNEAYVIKDIAREPALIQWFFSKLRAESKLAGHNIIGFDLKFLLKRALVLGLELPPDYLFPRALKPWDASVIDTATIFGTGQDMISLANLAAGLGIDGKIADGAQVVDMWLAGNFEDIRLYNLDDVRIVREAHKRMLKVGW